MTTAQTIGLAWVGFVVAVILWAMWLDWRSKRAERDTQRLRGHLDEQCRREALRKVMDPTSYVYPKTWTPEEDAVTRAERVEAGYEGLPLGAWLGINQKLLGEIQSYGPVANPYSILGHRYITRELSSKELAGLLAERRRRALHATADDAMHRALTKMISQVERGQR